MSFPQFPLSFTISSLALLSSSIFALKQSFFESKITLPTQTQTTPPPHHNVLQDLPHCHCSYLHPRGSRRRRIQLPFRPSILLNILLHIKQHLQHPNHNHLIKNPLHPLYNIHPRPPHLSKNSNKNKNILHHNLNTTHNHYLATTHNKYNNRSTISLSLHGGNGNPCCYF